MKISDLLKQQKIFSNEIKARFNNGQIRLNGDVIKTDMDLPFNDPFPDPRFNTVKPPFEAGDWIFVNLLTKLTGDKKEFLKFIFCLFDIETLFSGDCQINNKPVEEILPELKVMNNHIFLRTSKKQSFILKLTS